MLNCDAEQVHPFSMTQLEIASLFGWLGVIESLPSATPSMLNPQTAPLHVDAVQQHVDASLVRAQVSQTAALMMRRARHVPGTAPQ